MSSRAAPVWPNFFIVGTMRGGTTALYEYLLPHPEIFLSTPKEPHFFSGATDRFSETILDEARYLALFAGVDRPAIGEASASYLWSERAADQILAHCPRARIVILLRDPIARAHSHYLWEVRNAMEPRSFGEAIRADYAAADKGWGLTHLYVDLGFYCAQVQRYLDRFGADRVLVLLSETLRREVVATIAQVHRFLGVDDRFAATVDPQVHNAYGAPRRGAASLILASPWVRQLSRALIPKRLRKAMLNDVLLTRTDRPAIDRGDLDFLANLFEPDLRALEQLLARPLPELRLSWRPSAS